MPKLVLYRTPDYNDAREAAIFAPLIGLEAESSMDLYYAAYDVIAAMPRFASDWLNLCITNGTVRVMHTTIFQKPKQFLKEVSQDTKP